MLALGRIAGASFPFASSMVQLQAELTGRELQARLRRIEDPISHVHPQVREVSEQIYAALTEKGDFPLTMSEEFYAQYARPLAMLEAELYLDATHAIGKRYAGGFWANNPAFVLYMCALFEDPAKMNALVQRIDTAAPGTTVNGKALAAELGLPVGTVRAVCETFADKGLGIMSKEVGATYYIARA